MQKDKAIKLAGQRTDLIEALNNRLDKAVSASQKALLELVISDFVDSLDTDGGRIKNTLRNQRLVALLDKVFQTYAETHSPAVLKEIVHGVSQVLNFNHRYFSFFDKPAELLPVQKQVKNAISSWLGIEEGTTAKNGYLDVLVKADAVKQQIKDLAISKVVNQAGLSETRKAVRDMLTEDVESGQNQLGGLQKYYRNFTYDLYSQVDRTAAKISADKLDLKYAIYEGGLIKTSRKFCKERNGKVFTSEEIAAFDPPNKQPGYEPFTNLGGWACRHHLNFIPLAVAVSLRPDLKK